MDRLSSARPQTTPRNRPAIRKLGVGVFCALLACGSALAYSLSQAQADARQGRADQAIAEAQSSISANPLGAQRLLCALYMSVDDYDNAVHACEAAASLASSSSQDQLALARAYGAKAGGGSMLTGMALVSRIRHAFERAVQLDPQNVEALSDLGEFYVEAPSVVGGGLARARDLLPRLAAISPARGHRLAGMIALASKDYGTAEREFNQELTTAPTPEAYVDLARYNQRHAQWQQAADDAAAAIQHDPRHAADTLDAAAILVSLKRDLPVAEQALRQYIATPQTSMAAPLAKAHTVLGDALLATGDAAAAKQQFRDALDLAHSYAPALRGWKE